MACFWIMIQNYIKNSSRMTRKRQKAKRIKGENMGRGCRKAIQRREKKVNDHIEKHSSFPAKKGSTKSNHKRTLSLYSVCVCRSVMSNSLWPQASLSIGLSRQKYWRELPFSSPKISYTNLSEMKTFNGL